MSENTDVVSITLDPITSAVLRVYAESRGVSREEAIAGLLYRQAAAMTGWPGRQGQDLERAMLNQALPIAPAGAAPTW